MRFTENEIESFYNDSLKKAKAKLSSLPVAAGQTKDPMVRGLNGWVFEQTIRFCLSQELAAVGIRPQMEEQVPLSGRASIDLLVGRRVAIELKARGSFGKDDSKYEGYRKAVEERGLVYIYLTLQESYDRYKATTEKTFGEGRTFFLDTPGDWKRFVDAVFGYMA